MSQKKQKRKQKFEQEQKKKPPSSASLFSLKEYLKPALLIAAIAFILYAPTITYDFTLDDYSAIVDNTQTKQGLSATKEIFTHSYRYGSTITGDDLYRPIPKIVFAALWQFSPENASAGHFLNVLLYALTGFLLFIVLIRFFKGKFFIPFCASLLFVTHPIHTEVVASVKSMDEILCLLFFLVSIFFLQHFLEGKKKRWLIISVISYLFSLLSKESAITFIAIYPLMLYFFYEGSVSSSIKRTLPFLGVAILFLIIRNNVLGSITSESISPSDNALMAIDNPAFQKATALYYFGLYGWKLLFPALLTFDYSLYQLPVVSATNWRFLLSLIGYGAISVYAVTRFRKKDFHTFGILFLLITASISSNLLIHIGTHFGERLMYVPSIGFCISLAAFIFWLTGNKKEEEVKNNSLSVIKLSPLSFMIVSAITLLYGFKTFIQNPTWRNNLTLYESGVARSPKSMRTHYYLGNYLIKERYYSKFPESEQKEIIERGISELKKSTAIYPPFAESWEQIGVIYARIKQNDSAFYYYQKALEKNPGYATAHNNLGALYFDTKQYDQALNSFSLAVKYDPYYADAHCNLATSYAVKGNAQTAITHYNKAIELNPDYAMAYYFLGITYQNMGNASQAKINLDRAGQLDPKYRK